MPALMKFVLSALLWVCAAAPSALAQSSTGFSLKPVRLVVPFSPTGGADIIARTLAQKLTETWGVQVIVDNRAATGGVVAFELVASSPADGYTLVMGQLGSVALNLILHPKLACDPVREFAPVSPVAPLANLLVVHPSLPGHAVAVARELGIRTVVIPPYCGVFSAVGMLLADAKDEYIISHIRPFGGAAAPEIEKFFAQMEADGTLKMLKAGFARDKVVTRRALEMRYVGQEFTLIIDIPVTSIADAMAGVRAKFNRDYEARYGQYFPELSLEIVSLRLQVFGLFIKPEQNFAQAAQKGMAKDERRQDYFDDAGFVDGPIYKRMALPNNLVIDVGGYNMQAS